MRSVIKGDQLISECVYVDQAIADYFQEVYGDENYKADSDENLLLWTQ